MAASSLMFLMAYGGIAHGDDSQACDRATALSRVARNAFEGGDAATARDLLRRAVTMCQTVPMRFNLGLALRATGEFTEARHLLRELSEEELSADERETVQREIDSLTEVIAILRIALANDEGVEAEVSVDGIPVGIVAAEDVLEVPVDPGQHRVHALSARARGRADPAVAPGTTVDLRLEMTPLDKRRPWLAVGLLAGATAVVAGAVALVLVYTGSDDEWPGDPITGVTATLGR